jgi:hypothetical protein
MSHMKTQHMELSSSRQVRSLALMEQKDSFSHFRMFLLDPLAYAQSSFI